MSAECPPTIRACTHCCFRDYGIPTLETTSATTTKTATTEEEEDLRKTKDAHSSSESTTSEDSQNFERVWNPGYSQQSRFRARLAWRNVYPGSTTSLLGEVGGSSC